jgi:hypothetical protein
VLELGDRIKDPEEPPADWGDGVDALVQDDQTDPAFLELLGKLDQVLQEAAGAVQLGDYELVAPTQYAEGLAESG